MNFVVRNHNLNVGLAVLSKDPVERSTFFQYFFKGEDETI